MSTLARVSVTAALVAALAGCGSAGGPKSPGAGAARTVVRTVTQTQAPTAAQPATIVVKPVHHLTGFSSPTANIGCYIDRHGVRCDIRQRAWKPPPTPAHCDLDYGQGLEISAGAKPRFVCAGDTALGGRAKLAYGHGIQAGVLRCVSMPSAMTCEDTRSHRGFSLARERYRLF